MSMRYTGKWKMNRAAGARYCSGISMISQIRERKKLKKTSDLRKKILKGLDNCNPNIVSGKW